MTIARGPNSRDSRDDTTRVTSDGRGNEIVEFYREVNFIKTIYLLIQLTMVRPVLQLCRKELPVMITNWSPSGLLCTPYFGPGLTHSAILKKSSD